MPYDTNDYPDEFDNDRCNEVYQQLIDETEIKSTYRNREKNDLLKKLLELMEYLRGDGSDNPVTEWFEREE